MNEKNQKHKRTKKLTPKEYKDKIIYFIMNNDGCKRQDIIKALVNTRLISYTTFNKYLQILRIERIILYAQDTKRYFYRPQVTPLNTYNKLIPFSKEEMDKLKREIGSQSEEIKKGFTLQEIFNIVEKGLASESKIKMMIKGKEFYISDRQLVKIIDTIGNLIWFLFINNPDIWFKVNKKEDLKFEFNLSLDLSKRETISNIILTTMRRFIRHLDKQQSKELLAKSDKELYAIAKFDSDNRKYFDR